MFNHFGLVWAIEREYSIPRTQIVNLNDRAQEPRMLYPLYELGKEYALSFHESHDAHGIRPFRR